MTIAPSTGSGTSHNIDGTLEVIAILALVALLAGLVGLYMTRNRALPVVAAADAGAQPPFEPPTAGLYTPPPADTDHDWTSQTPGPPPPPPPPSPGLDEETP